MDELVRQYLETLIREGENRSYHRNELVDGAFAEATRRQASTSPSAIVREVERQLRRLLSEGRIHRVAPATYSREAAPTRVVPRESPPVLFAPAYALAAQEDDAPFPLAFLARQLSDVVAPEDQGSPHATMMVNWLASSELLCAEPGTVQRLLRLQGLSL